MSSDNTDQMKALIVLVEFDESWRTSFEQERIRIIDCSGSSLRGIQHFGSTAIPNLVAKPIIDMMAPVPSVNEGKRCGSMLRDMGYVPVEADFSKRVLFRRDDAMERRAYHLHLVVCPSWPVKNELLFRDWLINHADAVDEYGALKQRLADQCGDNLQCYTMGKNEFVRGVVIKARSAAGLPAETDWSE